MRVASNARGHYRFIESIPAYSAGVVADTGHEIVHVTLHAGVPWRDGFDIADDHLRAEGHERHALCAIQLRCPEPYTFGGFDEFNAEYRGLLDAWDVCVDGLNPIARTNVAPVVNPPSVQCLYAFSYVRPAPDAAGPTFVIAGSGEYDEATGIHREGDTSAEAMRDKAGYVMGVMSARLEALGVGWDLANRTNVYTARTPNGLTDAVLGGMGAARRHGLHLFDARPPIVGIEFEMDVRGVAHERHV